MIYARLAFAHGRVAPAAADRLARAESVAHRATHRSSRRRRDAAITAVRNRSRDPSRWPGIASRSLADRMGLARIAPAPSTPPWTAGERSPAALGRRCLGWPRRGPLGAPVTACEPRSMTTRSNVPRAPLRQIVQSSPERTASEQRAHRAAVTSLISGGSNPLSRAPDRSNGPTRTRRTASGALTYLAREPSDGSSTCIITIVPAMAPLTSARGAVLTRHVTSRPRRSRPFKTFSSVVAPAMLARS